MTRGAWLLTALLSGLLGQVSGCGGDDTGDGAASGGQAGSAPAAAGSGGVASVPLEVANAMCDTLGDLCHITGYSEGLVAECHRLGHAREPDVCVERFVECANECLSLRPHAGGTVAGTAGAEGQGGESHGGAAGAPEHGEVSGSDLCLALGDLCHEAAEAGGLAAECHEIGHDGDAQQCQERFEECAVACVVGGDSGAGEGGAGSGGAAGAGG